MRFKSLWRYAFKELKNKRFFSVFFTTNLVLGLVGFIFLGNFHIAVEDYFATHLKKTLNADIQIFSRAKFPEDLDDILKNNLKTNADDYKKTVTTSLFSMVTSKNQTSLFNIRVIDEQFKLYTDFAVNGSDVVPLDIAQNLQKRNGIWLNERAMEILDVQIGDTLKIGKSDFILNKQVTISPQMGVGFSAFVPNAYIGQKQLENTGLVQFGSRINYELGLKFNQVQNSASLERIKETIQHTLKKQYKNEQIIKIRSLKDASRRLGKLFDYVSGFLGLIALVALFLSGVGTAFLYRNFAISRLQVISITHCLGMKKTDSLIIMLLQLLMLAMAACIGAGVFGAGLSYASSHLFVNILDGFVPKIFDLPTLLGGLLIAVCSSVLFSTPSLWFIKDTKPIALIKGGFEASDKLGIQTNWLQKIIKLWVYLPGLLLFYLIASTLTDATKGAVFMAFLLLALGVLFACIISICFLSGWLSHRAKGILKVALRNVARNKNTVASSSIAIALGVFLVAIIPQITQGVRHEIEQPAGSVLPSFFLIDIQDEQIKPVRDFVKKAGYELNFVSPMIRARLKLVNGQAVDQLSDNDRIDGNNWGRTRGFNLSYRDALSPAENLVAGRPLKKSYQFGEIAELSMEQDFAKDNNFQIGDKLVFDVQGVDVESVIVNLRSVRWNSFQPNFFVSLQSGVLEHAPKTFIANIKGIESHKKLGFQKKLVRQFPNITAIDVEHIVQSTLNIASKALGMILFLAVIAILSGMLVMLSIALMQVYQKRMELSLLKILGGSNRKLNQYILLEFVAPGFLAILVGVGLSIAASMAFSMLLFGRIFTIEWISLAWILIISTSIILSLSIAISHYVSRFKPLYSIRETV